MIKVYHYPTRKKLSDDMVYSLTDNGGGILTLRVSLMYHSNRVTLAYAIDINADKEKVFDLTVHDGRSEPIIEPFEIYKFADKYTTTVTESGSIKVARVVIDDQLNTLILLCRGHDDIDGFENVIIEDGHTPTHYMMQDSEWLLKKKNALWNKYQFIKDVDIFDSASYLEAQVDLLTKLVIDLLNGKEADQDALSMLEIANNYSVLNTKSTESICEEFTEKKADFRERQKKYYENRP